MLQVKFYGLMSPLLILYALTYPNNEKEGQAPPFIKSYIFIRLTALTRSPEFTNSFIKRDLKITPVVV